MRAIILYRIFVGICHVPALDQTEAIRVVKVSVQLSKRNKKHDSGMSGSGLEMAIAMIVY